VQTKKNICAANTIHTHHYTCSTFSHFTNFAINLIPARVESCCYEIGKIPKKSWVIFILLEDLKKRKTVSAKGRYTIDIFTYNISIKRHWDKKILRQKDIFSSIIFFL